MDQVGHYRITAELHRGTHGVVYQAQNSNDGRIVALRAIQLPVPESPAALPSLSALLALSHPNIVPVFEAFVQQGFAFIATEYLDGISFASALQQSLVRGYEHLLQHLRQVAAALDYAHRKSVVHGDLNAADIFLLRARDGVDGTAKVTGFGERALIEGAPVDVGRDQLALAELTHESLTGQRATASNEVSSALSPTVAKVLQRALAQSAADRFQTSSDFVGALGIALGEGKAAYPQIAHSVAAPGITAPSAAIATAATAPVLSFSGAATATTQAPAILPPSTVLAPERRDRTTQIRKQERERTPFLKSVAFLVFLCFVAAAALIFMVRMNSGPQVPVQVLETKSVQGQPPPAPTSTTSTSPAPQSTQTAVPGSETAKPAVKQQSARSEPAAPSQTQPANAQRAAVQTQTQARLQPRTADDQSSASIADVDLVSEPPGAKLVVDGRADATCTAPCTMALPAGRHTLTAELSGYTVARRILNIPDTNRLIITLEADTGTVLVTSTPAGASIFIDGKAFGNTPATLHLPAGLHTLLLFNGSRQHEESIQIQPDTFQARAVTW